ncbi:MAG: transcriptional regulator, MarR family [Actinomycetia bacterium]|nr:transcriptional regulator, MarR family [Actinomycetes bacterium]
MAGPSGFATGSGVAPAQQPAGDPCTLSHDLGWAVGTVLRAYAKAAHAALEGLPGGPRGFQVLAAAAEDAHGSQLALAHRLGVDRTVMTYLLDDLEKAGLIERRPDPADRRARRIVVTAGGQDKLAGLNERLRAAEEQVLSGLDEADQQAFRTLVRRLAMSVSSADPLRGACEAATEVAGTDGISRLSC